MQKSKQDLKTKLMKEAEAVIDELLAWHVETEQPNLAQIEEKVLDLRQRLSEQMSQAVIANQEAVRPVPGPACGRCGQEMRYKDMKKVRVSSWVGELKLERGYYYSYACTVYCDHCRSGLFAPGPTT
jgi:hypothetical protein